MVLHCKVITFYVLRAYKENENELRQLGKIGTEVDYRGLALENDSV